MVLRGFKPADIAAKMGKTRDAILKKIERIGLEVAQSKSIVSPRVKLYAYKLYILSITFTIGIEYLHS